MAAYNYDATTTNYDDGDARTENGSGWADDVGVLPAFTGGAELMPGYARVLVIVAYCAVVVLALGGNVTVCCIVLVHKRMRTVTNYFIVSLACSDILMASLCVPFTFVANVLVHYWPFGAALCPIVPYAQVRGHLQAVWGCFLSTCTLRTGERPFGVGLCPIVPYAKVRGHLQAVWAALCPIVHYAHVRGHLQAVWGSFLSHCTLRLGERQLTDHLGPLFTTFYPAHL